MPLRNVAKPEEVAMLSAGSTPIAPVTVYAAQKGEIPSRFQSSCIFSAES